MNALRIAVCIFLFGACNYAADFNTSGSLSDRLALAVSYQADESQFKVVLSNQTKSALTLRVDPRQFHGRILVTSTADQVVEFLDSAFLPKLLTSIWDVPLHTLQPHTNITWTLPLANLRDIHDGQLTAQQLQRVTVRAKLDEIAVVPPSHNFISDNAKQVSTPVTIPSQPR